MSVPKILSGLTDLSSQLKHIDVSKSKSAAGKAVTAAQPSLAAPTAAMRAILSHYDMTDISPSDFSKLIQQLSDKGTITQKESQELTAIRVDLENAGVSPDESVNLLEFYQKQIATVQAGAAQSSNPAAAKPNIDALVGRLNWLQKFAAASQQGGVNAVT